MVISDQTSVILAVEPFFQGFITPQVITDTSRSREVIVGVSTESRKQVDDLVGTALAAGAHDLGESQDDGFMYMRGFRDLDGHQWSFIYLDMSAVSSNR
jgi:predicted lactoylglutathione lyase